MTMDIPLPVLGPIIRHEGRGRAIEISAGRLETRKAQLAFLERLTAAINLNLAAPDFAKGEERWS